MGSDYYAYAVVGVKAESYIENKSLAVKVQQYNSGQALFDASGNPILKNKEFNYFVFQGKNFISDHNREEARKTGVMQFEDVSFENHISESELEWFSDDFETVYDSDLIGIRISYFSSHGNDQEGVSLSKLPDLFAKAKNLLEKVGITKEPKLYTSFYHSY